MASAAALISLAASYEKRFGRASLGTLRELARQYDGAANAPGSAAPAPDGRGHDAGAQRLAAPIVAHVLARIASLKRELMEIVAHPAAEPPADCAETGAAQALAEQVDVASRLQCERGEMPLPDWIRRKARADMPAMSEQALLRHLQDLEWICNQPCSALAGDDHSQLMNEVAAALHIGWLLQEEFSGAGAHTDTESLLLAKMTPYEREQYEVRKENARRRQEFRRKKPEIFSLDAARRQARLGPRHARRTN